MATKTSRQLQLLAENARKQVAAVVAPSQKRAADSPGKNAASRKRAVLGDITNPNNPAAMAAAAVKAGIKAPPKKAVLRARGGAATASTSKAAAAGAKPTATTEQPQEKAKSAGKAPQTSAATLTGSRKQQQQPDPALPAGVVDFDYESRDDPFAESTYAADIFNYYKEREVHFLVDKYLERQAELSVSMRAVLVDWMVEVQENFELNHETLYLAVKLVDRYLCLASSCPKARLQLVGATALFVACKFDERCPPSVRDFLYICDDAYGHDELIDMEAQLLKVLDYELGMPLSYRFLRRYARCGQLPLETLTLARYVLESSLLDYSLVDQRESKAAAAALLQALLMKGLSWNETLRHYSGYKVEELRDLQQRMNQFLSEQKKGSLEAIRSKYLHKVFFEVALTPLLPVE